MPSTPKTLEPPTTGPAPQTAKGKTAWRRWAQLLFLALFASLLWLTRTSSAPQRADSLFFLADPLVMGTAMIATRTVTLFAVLTLAMLLVAMLFGRIFCGWACPLGSLLDIFGPPKHRTLLPMHRRYQESWRGWWRHLRFALLASFVG